MVPDFDAGVSRNVASAIDVAKYFAETWGIPYVVGIPMGEKQAIQLAEQIHHPLQTPKPVKAQKPADISDVTSMAKFLFDAATEFWAVEKDFSGTTTRPVSTRVAASIGAGTAVDCPGGDTVRVDKNGVEHDSYAIADHFRAYVEMPDLQYFKIYLSDKDYTVNPYGAREDVVGSYYQYGSERANYEPEEEEADEPSAVTP